ncbi:glycosyl transferase [Rhizobium sp. Leaf453]|nr:glycosyl transferase [Rhizobium sp. Leaf386]KQT05221.1 glycosyl transferase [Rhizobium sp. Leaf391]KQU02206.1 glycosyl transferase [Rhizobium sp. Leaf453]
MIFANRYFYPDQSATSRVVSKLAFALAERGFDVQIITSRALHDRTDQRLEADETIAGVRIARIPTSHFGRETLAGRMIDYVVFHVAAFAWWLRHVSKGDICVICTDPPLLAVTSAFAIKIRRGTLVNWILDLFPETAIELSVLPRKGWTSRILLRFRDASLRWSEIVVCPTLTMAQHIRRQSVTTQRVAVVHNFSDQREIYAIAPAENGLRAEWALQGKFVIGYSGNFGRAHEFDTMIGAAGILRDRSDVRFLLIGSGQKLAVVRNKVDQLGLKNVLFKPLQPSDKLAESLCAADLHVVSLMPQLEHCIVPSKFYGILAAGRPTAFIGDRCGEVARAIATSGCGETIQIGDAAGLAAMIGRLKESPELRAGMAKAAQHLLQTEFSTEKAVDLWTGILTTLQVARDARAANYRRQPS